MVNITDYDDVYLDWREPAFLQALKDSQIPWLGRDIELPKIGVTNGVFDVLHIGHVSLIRAIQKYQFEVGEIHLVVLLNSDASAKRLKGLKRPYYPFLARACMLSELRMVSYVAGFDEDTPAEALETIRPHFLFKSDEYAGKKLPGAEHCGKVVLFPMLPGVSTTKVADRIVLAGGRDESAKDG